MHLIGLDWVFIDTEHIAISRSELSWMCRTYRAMNLPPVVRVPAPDPYQVTMALDDAAAGVMVPYIESAEQAPALVGATKFRPLKGQKLQSILQNKEQIEDELAEYMAKHNAANSLILNIESVPAMKNLSQILEVRGIDALMIGPHDLSASLGVPEQYGHRRFVAAVDEIIDRATDAGISVGIHAGFTEDIGIEAQVRWAERGANLILHAADIIAFTNSMRHDISCLRAAMKCETSRKTEAINI